jgi:hypothetical protein
MWRALFLAIGAYLVLLGGQCLGVQKFVLKPDKPEASESWLDPRGLMTTRREVIPQPWVPYSLMSTGTIVCVYCFSIPKRLSGGKPS